MKRRITWLRISYWAAAAGDFLIAILVFIPEINGETRYSIVMGMMSSAAFSWGVLLIMADRKPLERRWVLLPTMLVVSLLAIVVTIGGFSGTIPMIRAVGRTAAYILVLTLLFYSYSTTRRMD